MRFLRWIRRRLIEPVRLWLQNNPFGPLDTYVARHENCCARAVYPWRTMNTSSARFNRVLQDCYEDSGNFGCKASGYERRFMLALFVTKQRGWRF